MSEGLRILFVYREFHKFEQGDGTATYLVALGQGLAERGHEVHVLCSDYGLVEADYRKWGFQVHVRVQTKVPGLRKIMRGRWTALRLETAVSEYRALRGLDTNFDVVEFPELGADGLIYALRHRFPLVAHLHSPLAILGKYWGSPDNFDYRVGCELERWSVDHADVVTSPSRLMLQEVARLGWLRGVRSEVVPNPVDYTTWQNVGPASQTKPVILFVGRLESLKAPDVILKAVSYLRRYGLHVQVVLVGGRASHSKGDQYAERFHRLAESIGGCEFLDFIPRRELPALMERVRVVVIPSKFESYSMVAVEAMASARPVVATTTTGVAEFMREHGAGQVVPPGDPEALGEVLRPLLQDPEYAAEVGARARQLVKEHLSPVRIAEKREGVYRNAIRAHAGE